MLRDSTSTLHLEAGCSKEHMLRKKHDPKSLAIQCAVFVDQQIPKKLEKESAHVAPCYNKGSGTRKKLQIAQDATLQIGPARPAFLISQRYATTTQ